MDRRAFGKFVGPRGEFASYAFGWTAGADPHLARLSVGIGVGNPGGGVWWVVDQVMERDRRAWWMLHWLRSTTSIQTLEVLERREPILLVGHDADDGLWQLIGPTPAEFTTGKIGHLHHAVDEDPTLVDVLDLPSGHRASRTHVGAPWIRQVGYPD